MKRFFEKISKEQFLKDFSNFGCNYEDIIIPIRATNDSAGYDFYLPFDIEIKPNEVVKIPTGIKVSMYDDEMLIICVRSSVGFKYNIRMCNQIGIIDSSYYNNKENEGGIWIALHNHSNKAYKFRKKDRLVQGIFQKFLTIENDEFINNIRVGGLGSTNTKEEDYE